jgi:hypothetical protein
LFIDVAGHGPVFVDRRDVDDVPSAALPDHLAGRQLGAEESALQVDPKHGVVLLLGGVEQRGTGLDAGIVHHDVQAAERLHGGVDEALKVGDLADIGVDPDGSIPERDDSPFEFLGRISVRDVVDCDVGALFRQLEHDSLSDSAIAAGDDRNLALQKHNHPFSV